MKDFIQEIEYAVAVLSTASFPSFSCTCGQAYQLLKNTLYFAIYHLFHLCVQTTFNNKGNNVKLFSKDIFLLEIEPNYLLPGARVCLSLVVRLHL